VSDSLTAAGFRRLMALLDENRPTMDDDRLFFEQHPDRSYRVRPCSAAEHRMEQISAMELGPPPDSRWYTVVKPYAPFMRLWTIVVAPPIVSEDDAHLIFEAVEAAFGTELKHFRIALDWPASSPTSGG
jgi:hypothetical protein